jgi:hypothetical protein
MNAVPRKHASSEMIGDGIICICRGPGMLVLDFRNSSKPMRAESILETSR